MDLHRVKGFMLDMDGTFYLGDHLLPGALAFLDLLNQKGLAYTFLTNNSSKNREEYVKKLTRLGVKPKDARVYTSGDATIRYIKDHFPNKKVFLVGTPGLENAFIESGVELDPVNPDLVVLGYDTTLTYQKCCDLCDMVKTGLPYIATHPDINCPAPHGFVPDIGAMMALVETSTGRKADLIIGKPNRIMVELIAAELKVPMTHLAMVGDRLYTDIALGSTAGVTTILLLSGESKLEDLETSPFKPDYIFQDLAELAQHML